MTKYCVGHVIPQPLPGVDLAIIEAASKEDALEIFWSSYADHYGTDLDLFNDIWLDEIFYRMPDGSNCYDPETGKALATDDEILVSVTANVRKFFGEQTHYANIFLSQLRINGYKDVLEYPLAMRVYMVYNDIKNDPNEEFYVFAVEELAISM